MSCCRRLFTRRRSMRTTRWRLITDAHSTTSTDARTRASPQPRGHCRRLIFVQNVRRGFYDLGTDVPPDSLKGTENSGSSRKFVLTNQAAQHIAPADASTMARGKGWIGQSFRRLQAETSMRPSGVVVRGLGLKDALQMAAGRRPESSPGHLVRTVRTHRSANGWLAGPGSDLDDLTPSDRNTSSTRELGIPIGVTNRAR
jgi:hypothetical protein